MEYVQVNKDTQIQKIQFLKHLSKMFVVSLFKNLHIIDVDRRIH